jgi:hypothetical protein
VKLILDKELLTGHLETNVSLRPLCLARFTENLDTATSDAARLCQTWGGAGNILVPVGHNGRIARYLRNQLREAELDGYTWKDQSHPQVQYLHREIAWDTPALLVALNEQSATSRPISVADLDSADPWYLPYRAALGWMESSLHPFLAQRGGLTEETHDLNQWIPVHRHAVTGSLKDLLERLSDEQVITPRQFSTLYLATGQEPNTGFMDVESIIPNRWRQAIASGPNVVVVMQPGSVDDFALLWNLRAQWGDYRCMPIGLPADQLDQATIEELRQPGVATYFGFSGGEICLVSQSLDFDTVSAMAGSLWQVKAARPSDLVRVGLAPGMHRGVAQTWSQGQAVIPSLTDGDRKVLSDVFRSSPTLRLSVDVPSSPIPVAAPLHGWMMGGFACGRSIVGANLQSQRTSATAYWPSGWTSLVASALELGFEVRESQPGVAAMRLLEALEDAQEAIYLCDDQLIALLYQMAERSGMSWWKRRWSGLEVRLRESGWSESGIQALSAETDAASPVIASAEEGRELTYSALRRCFGSQATTDRWIEWAQERRLLVKGVEVRCSDCRATFWVPMDAIARNYVCPGCARRIEHPYRSDSLNFRYRIGEVLRRCLELDCLGHVLALRWLVQLFQDYGLVGAHPGVEFVKDGRVVAELDVVLLFRDGSLVPVEVKRRAAGFSQEQADAADAFNKQIDARFDVVCIPERIEPTDDIHKFGRLAPLVPRFILSLDQLQQTHVIWGAGRNPFTYRDEEDRFGPVRQQWLNRVASIGSEPVEDAAAVTVEYWQRHGPTGSHPSVNTAGVVDDTTKSQATDPRLEGED